MVIIRILKSSSIDLGESNRSPYAKMKAWMIDGSRRRAVEIGFLALLAIMVWGLFSLPTVFYLRSKTSKVLLLRTTRTYSTPVRVRYFRYGKEILYSNGR